MKINEIFNQNRKVFSFEVFPPKKQGTIESITSVLGELSALEPDFISVTYGAGGNTADESTCKIASMIKNEYHIESMAHLTCVNSTKDDVSIVLGQLKAQNIENILALRGDINPDLPRREDFHYSCELVRYIKEQGDFHISGACYPEVHVDAKNMQEDIEHLKIKVDAGVSHLISQLFFDNDLFYHFNEKVRAAGIQVPIEAGIMPVSNKKQIERMVTMCGASIPQKLAKILQRYEYDSESLREAGIEYAIKQMEGLLEHGVDGLHLYTMNNPYIASQISKEVKGLL
ncbi:MAG: methylenetetrahydrofolate reductase [NAD(P)H] [Clostridiales bacterium]|nr:methylenetetrahydrofolate reductase [NAD(P)H] [Clostridiales bacterium]